MTKKNENQKRNVPSQYQTHKDKDGVERWNQNNKPVKPKK